MDTHHNYTLGAELHFEQNYTLGSRTTLCAELHFEQNYTQNSKFRNLERKNTTINEENAMPE
jgi:hypothetical protein